MMVLQGLIGMTLGMLLLIYRAQVKDFTGDLDFAESWFGAGGTWTFLALLGILIFVLSLMWMTGTFQAFFSSKFASFL